MLAKLNNLLTFLITKLGLGTRGMSGNRRRRDRPFRRGSVRARSEQVRFKLVSPRQ